MRSYVKRQRDTHQGLRPQGREDWLSLAIFAGYLSLGVSVTAGLFYLKQRSESIRAQSWISASATIEDVRGQRIGFTHSRYGGAMLYEVQVLVKYSDDGSWHEQWTTVLQMPRVLDDVEFEKFRWKGKSCLVRWKASDPNDVVAEVR